MRTRRFWGWGYEEEGPDPSAVEVVRAGIAMRFGSIDLTAVSPPRIEEIDLPPPRLRPPASLAKIVSEAPLDRAGHTYGKSYRDVVRGYRRDFRRPPDLVAFPETDAHVVELLDWCNGARVAAVPYGGGSSVCGGVEPDVGDGFAGAVSIDLARLDKVLEIDRASRSARIQAGILGPALEDQLRPHGLTLRHYPQSFELSTLGGWIATRSGGHFATLHTHLDEFVQALRVVTPTGIVATRRLPGSGAGPSPERLFIGSEGILGVITEAWMRLQERPRFRATLAARFGDFSAGALGVRAVAQSGLHPANCRLLDPTEALLNGAGDGQSAVLIVGFESADHPVDAWIARAAECCRDAGGQVLDGDVKVRTGDGGSREGVADAWRSAFIRMPYLRDALVGMGVFTETFETAVTWDRFDELHARVVDAAHRASLEIVGPAIVTCRVTHAYPDGAAPYFTVIAPARRGDELEQWRVMKTAITEAMLDAGGTVTHHHAVGRDVRVFYERERPDGFARALAAAKRELDPAGVLNPGVLLPASPSPSRAPR